MLSETFQFSTKNWDTQKSRKYHIHCKQTNKNQNNPSQQKNCPLGVQIFNLIDIKTYKASHYKYIQGAKWSISINIKGKYLVSIKNISKDRNYEKNHMEILEFKSITEMKNLLEVLNNSYEMIDGRISQFKDRQIKIIQ